MTSPDPGIRSAAVVGSGTMGAGIASHLANAGVPVVLLDIVPPGSGDRDGLAKGAVERMLRATPPAFMDRADAARITPGNLEDHLHLLADADWIAEAVVERLEVKRALYRRLDTVRRPGSFVSSNTSTLPLALLVEGMPESFRRDFCITHFFNPVRYMRLLELVSGPDTRAEVVDTLAHFCDVALGKGVVRCRDTPGFLGNRVGVYALQAGLVEAQEAGLTVEEADALMGRPMGIPKTGLFGLYDLIGIDLMQDVVTSLKLPLPDSDPFYEVAPGIPLLQALVASGRTGDKGGAGFYRTRTTGGEPCREVVDLATGEYRPAERPVPAAALAAESGGLRGLVEHPDAGGRFAWRVLARTLSYAASLLPEVADAPAPVDEAMKLGYSWAQGPFEMIDALGPRWFRDRLRAEGRPVPPSLDALLAAGNEATFYRARGGRVEQFSPDQGYVALERAPGVVRLGDLKRTRDRLLGNDAASLWDVGDGVACVEFHTKANALAPASMVVLADAVERAAAEFRALLIHNEAPHFSVGFNLEYVSACARRGAWSELDAALADFQLACRACRQGPVPVVGAPSGLGLGGGFEVLLHCNALQVHANITLGLVEALVGLIPAGGGCKALLERWTAGATGADEAETGALRVFELIGKARTASSPQEARPMRLLAEHDRVTMNRDRLLAEGKARALELAASHAPAPAPVFVALGARGMEAMEEVLQTLVQRGIALPHDVTVSRHLARVLCGGDAPRGATLTEDDLLALEREAFLALAATPQTTARIDHMLERGRPLRN
jgi:3-hydroxyacyl-CoA dehydrogenase